MDERLTVHAVHREQLMLASMLDEVGRTVDRIHSAVLEQLSDAEVNAHRAESSIEDIVYRHSIVLAFAGKCFDISDDVVVNVGVGALLSYSLPLTVIDRALDSQTGVGGELDKPVALSFLTHAGYLELSRFESSRRLTALVSSASLATLRAMRDDEFSRYPDVSVTAGERIDWHWNSERSRLNASNVHRLMLSACSILAVGIETEEIRDVSKTVGRFRQIADELLDVVEDTRDGLVTLPSLYALASRETSGAVAAAIANLRRPLEDAAAGDELRAVIIASGACERIEAEVAEEYRRAAHLCLNLPRPEYALALLVQRRLQIDRAIQQRLTDDQGGLAISELLAIETRLEWRETVETECLALGIQLGPFP